MKKYKVPSDVFSAGVYEVEILYKRTSETRVLVKDPNDIVPFIREHLYKESEGYVEKMFALFLDRSNKVYAWKLISMGGLHYTLVDVKVILNAAVNCLASSIIIVHNHPSGSTQPSNQDKEVTETLKQAMPYHDITLLDHIILTQKEFYSFADNNLV